MQFVKNPLSNLIRLRSYSQFVNGARETWEQTCKRTIDALAKLGEFTEAEKEAVYWHQRNMIAFGSSRWLWVGGTDWVSKPENYYGAFNCSSTQLDSWEKFGYLMNLAMTGCGTGAVIEQHIIAELPTICNKLNVRIVTPIGVYLPEHRQEHTEVTLAARTNAVLINVGDSRQGWVAAYVAMLELSSSTAYEGETVVSINLGSVRLKGEVLKGFGGVANPERLPEMFERIAAVTNGAIGRKLNSFECCLVMYEAAKVVVAGNIRRSASIGQGSANDELFVNAKQGLWIVDDSGNWKIDPARDCLRMANLTRVFHTKPTLQDCIDSVRLQFQSGEGAIQWAGEAVARANADVLFLKQQKREFLRLYSENRDEAAEYLRANGANAVTLQHRMDRYGLNPCAEIIGSNFLCNLASVHLNQLDPHDYEAQNAAFRASALQACALLKQGFTDHLYQTSREIDPIVGVSFTGGFTFFAKAFGLNWLRWFEAGRPTNFYVKQFNPETELEECVNIAGRFRTMEIGFLETWKRVVTDTVTEYCERHNLKVPNRVTAMKPEGCKPLHYTHTTDQGILFVDEIEPGITDREVGFKPALDGFTHQGNAICNGYNNGLAQIYKVVLSHGRILELTPNHRLSVNGEWIRTDQLRLGQKLDYQIGTYNNQVDYPLVSVSVPDIRYKGNAEADCITRINRYQLPTNVTPDLSYLIGAYFANGAFCRGNSERTRRFRYTCQHLNNCEKIKRLWLELFGAEVNIHRCKDRNCYAIDFASVEIGYWFEANGLTKDKSHNLSRIPEVIRKSSAESIIAFIAGYADNDGCFHSNTFSFDSVSETMIRHLQEIGEAVGLCFGYSLNSKRPRSFGVNPIHKITMQKTSSLPMAIDLINKHSVKAQSKPVLFSLNNNRAKQPFTVVSVEPIAGLQPTYDIEVANTHWYYQGGIKSHNSQTLLTGAGCCAYSPPKAWQYIRRMTFAAYDPIALAAIDYGYTVVPSQSDKDENGNLLNDPFDLRCTEWLVEVPVLEQLAYEMPEIEAIDPGQFSAVSQFDWYMQVQKHFVGHNVSATIELREHEIEPLAKAIHTAIEKDEGYVSAAILARFDANKTYPRLPFEPITRERYDELTAEVLKRRVSDDFDALIAFHSRDMQTADQMDGACNDGACSAQR